jgi:hypothetical protein
MGRNARRRSQARQTSAGSSRPSGPTSDDHPRLPPNAIETLVALVTAGELDSELHLLYNTIGDRIEAIEAARLANALARLSIGDRVRIGHDVRPAYVHGLPATVIRRGTDTITIQLDRPVGKFVDSCIRCSPLAVEKIGT